MARAVADAIETDGHAVVQAGTGTGKSLAYLVPAVLSDRPTVIATATKALQDQLAGKDLPFLTDHLDVPFRFAVLKGRSNYLCLQRLDELEADDRLDLDLDDTERDSGSIDSDTLDELRAFATTSATGDRSELETIDDRTWRLVSVGRRVPRATAAREATTVSPRRPATRPPKPTSSSSTCTCTRWRSPSMRCFPNTTSS